MLWYKDKSRLQRLFESIAIGLAIALAAFTVGFMYQKWKDNVCRTSPNSQHSPDKSTILHT